MKWKRNGGNWELGSYQLQYCRLLKLWALVIDGKEKGWYTGLRKAKKAVEKIAEVKP